MYREDICGYSRSIQTTARVLPEIGHDCFYIFPIRHLQVILPFEAI